MIVSLVFKEKWDVMVSERGYFNLAIKGEDGEPKVERQSIADIPFIRYRFERYGAEEASYIRKLQGIFKHSAHLAEIVFKGDTSETLEAVKYLENEVENLCKFVYIPVDDNLLSEVTDNRELPENLSDMLYDLSEMSVDQFCLKDKSSAAGVIQFNLVRKLVAGVVFGSARKYENIGICESPLTFVEDNSACLTAAKAREFMAVYCRDDLTQPTPSANHQCMGCCGCIKYIVVDSAISFSSNTSKPAKDKAAKPAKPAKEAKAKTAKPAKEAKDKKPKQVSIKNILF